MHTCQIPTQVAWNASLRIALPRSGYIYIYIRLCINTHMYTCEIPIQVAWDASLRVVFRSCLIRSDHWRCSARSMRAAAVAQWVEVLRRASHQVNGVNLFVFVCIVSLCAFVCVSVRTSQDVRFVCMLMLCVCWGMCMHTDAHACTHTNTHTHTHTHTYMHI